MLWIFAIFAILLAAYCVQEQRERFWPATILKVALSAFVAAVAWTRLIQKGVDAPLVLMAAGLTLAVPADYFLQYIKTDAKRYDAGILFFSGMHICLLLSFVDRYGVHWLEFAFFAAILLTLLLLQTLQKWNLGAQKLPLSVYTVLVALMAAKAVAVGVTFPSGQTRLLAAGGLCFVASDMILGVWDYHDGRKRFVLLNRIVYFCGQLLFALSIGLVANTHLDNLVWQIGEVKIGYGAFLTAVINFLIMALVLFGIVKTVDKAQALGEKAMHKGEAEAPAAPTTKVCPYCKQEIAIAATRCPHCTSQLTE